MKNAVRKYPQNLFLSPRYSFHDYSYKTRSSTVVLAGNSVMGRRKSKPNRSVGILEGEVPKGQINDLNVSDEFGNYILDEEFCRVSRYLLRFRVSNVNEYLTRIKLGHWPVLSTSSICLEIVAKQEMAGLEETVALVVGSFDGPDEVISGLVHLASLKFFTLRPVIMGHIVPGLDEISSAARKLSRFDVASFYEAIKPSKEEPMFDDDLPDLLSKLRPYQRRAAYWMVQREKRNSDGSLQSKINHFISPLCMPLSLIDTSINNILQSILADDQLLVIFCSLDWDVTCYFLMLLFSGNVSLRPESAPSVVPGGILADEMGLGNC
ncbi:hypothetical protein K7X08_035581 [Anisodus acutangulus]|uniref:Uncharacterized protein n=1 Tax=Anisodus acutangulus TaxID=402998 RepID=A0A9Q1R0R8_9SOLA|nr:hypothetical protein K7X08_035581 [Anisodus acutangulus]